MRLFAIFSTDGKARYSVFSPKNHLSEVPPPHNYYEGEVSAEILDWEGFGFDSQMSEHFAVHEWLRGFTLNGDQLDGTDPPGIVLRSAMINGALHDMTVDGWKFRDIFDGEEDDEGNLVGQWYIMGPRDKRGSPNFVKIPEPDPNARWVWRGPEGKEIPGK